MFIISLCLLLTGLQFQKTEATTILKRKSKTAGQLLDETFLMLKSEDQGLKHADEALKKRVDSMAEDVKVLKIIHGSCAPCQVVQGTDKYCDCTRFPPKKDCLEFHKGGFKVDGLYKINGPRFSSLTAYCDQKTMGGGWTVIQRRQDGSVDFNRKWNDYTKGFGHLESEFWFGNENIHDLTKTSEAPKKSTVLFNMKMRGKNVPVYAKYSTFQVGDSASKYILTISGFSGNASNTNMAYHNGMKFSTADQDNVSNCAVQCKSGWWFNGCYHVHLNGPYNTPGFTYNIHWNWSTKEQPEFVEIKVKRNG